MIWDHTYSWKLGIVIQTVLTYNIEYNRELTVSYKDLLPYKIVAVNMKLFAIIILCFGIAKTQSEEESFYPVYYDYEQSAEARYYYRKKHIKAEFFLKSIYHLLILKKFCWHNCFIIIYLASASCGVKKCWKDSNSSAKSKNTVEKGASFQVYDKR